MFKLNTISSFVIMQKNAIALAHTYSERKFTPVDVEITHKTSSMRNNSPLEMYAPVSKT